MVELSFRPAADPSTEILHLTIAAGEEPVASGDSSWLDYSFEPFSPRLGRAVSFSEDPEEWARSLATAYAGSPTVVEIVQDTDPPAAAPEEAPAAVRDHEPEPGADPSPFREDSRIAAAKRQERNYKIFKTVVAVLFALGLLALIGGPELLRERGPEPKRVLADLQSGIEKAGPKLERVHYELDGEIELVDSPLPGFEGPLALKASGDVGPGYFTADLKVDGAGSTDSEGTVLVRPGTLFVLYDEKWYRMDIDEDQLPAPGQVPSTFGNFGVETLASLFDFTSFTGPDIDGPTWMLEGKLRDDFRRSVAALGGQAKQLGRIDGLELELAVGQKDRLPHLIAMRLPEQELGKVGDTDLGKLRVKFDLVLTDWGKPAKLPQPKDAADLSQLQSAENPPVIPGLTLPAPEEG